MRFAMLNKQNGMCDECSSVGIMHLALENYMRL